jgi:hypothetical protein
MAIRYFQTDNKLLYIYSRQDIYKVKKFRKIIKELNAKKIKGDYMKTLKELHYYISVYTNIQTPNKGSQLPLDALTAYRYSIVC